MHQSEQYLCEALKASASGHELKTVVDRDLMEACRRRCAVSHSYIRER
jgi:hypothetical protein